jgi:hypothetical protein
MSDKQSYPGIVTKIPMTVVAVTVIIFCLSGLAIAGWVPTLPGAEPAPPSVKLLEESTDHLLMEWRLTGVDIQAISTEEGEFYRLEVGVQPTPSASAPGTPELPLLTGVIALPTGAVGKVQVVSAEWASVGNYRLYPRQLPRRDDDSLPLPFQYLPESYTLQKTIPEIMARVSAPQGWGGLPIAGVSVTPFRYQPSTGQLEIAHRIVVRVDFVRDGNDRIIHRRHRDAMWDRLYQTTLLNPPPSEPEILDNDEDEPARMLFIMWEEALETAQPLIDFHHQTGLRSEVWLVNGDIQPEEIKDTVRARFETGLEYVFIIGDGYYNNYHVPMFYWDPEDPGAHEADTDSYSDSWYVCLDPPDPDGYDDHLPDLAIGRLVYTPDHLEQLEYQVDKLVKYQRWQFDDPADTDWLTRGLLVADDEYDTVNGNRIYYYEDCKTYIAQRQYNFPHPEWIEIYGRDEDASNRAIEDAVNDTHIGLFNYRGHGNRTIWASWNRRHESWTNGYALNLTNANWPFVLVASACKNADIAYIQPDCLLEAFQKQAEGSVSAHGSVVSSFTDGNSYFDKAIFDAWFDDGVWSLGYAAAQTVTQMVERFDQEGEHGYMVVGRMNARAYIWLGDPALELRTEAPESLDIIFFPVPLPDDETISAMVSLDDEPFPGARLCVRTTDDSIYAVGTSDNEGIVEMQLPRPLTADDHLYWTLYHHNTTPTDGELFLAEGAGAIQGTVTELANGNPITGAEIILSPFRAHAESDTGGHYHFYGVPAMQCRLTVSADGFLSQSRDVEVVINDTVTADFAMAFAQLALDSAEIRQYLWFGQELTRELLLTNVGNGALVWSSDVIARGVRNPYELTSLYDAGGETGGDKLLGVEYADGEFYITGSNFNADPNYIYVLDRDGWLERSFRQPNESAGVGIHDLAWDGNYLYGSSHTATIFKLSVNGEVVSTIAGPHIPSKALAIDGDGNLWCGMDAEPLILIDADGNRLQTIYHSWNVKALAWYPDAPNDMNLQLLVSNSEDTVMLYQANPETGEIIFAADLTEGDGFQPGEGLAVAKNLEDGEWSLLTMLEHGADRFIKAWHLGYLNDWAQLNPDEGEIGGGENTVAYLTLSAADRFEEGLWNADLVIRNNGREPTVVVPITMEVGPQFAPGIPPNHPSDFSVGEAYPNPFNTVTCINVALPSPARLVVSLYDIQGRLVKRLSDDDRLPGDHRLTLGASDLSSGIYILQVTAGASEARRKIVLMR